MEWRIIEDDVPVQKQQHSCFLSDVDVALEQFKELPLNIMFCLKIEKFEKCGEVCIRPRQLRSQRR